MSESVDHGREQMTSTERDEVLAAVRAALSRLPEPERLRRLGGLLLEMADDQAATGAGADAECAALNKRLQRLAEEKAQLDDELAAARADLKHRGAQLEAERQRSSELERILADQRARWQGAQTSVGELEQRLAAKERQWHDAQRRMDELEQELQRATARSERVPVGARERVEPVAELEEWREKYEALRRDKDEQIETVKRELQAAREAQQRSGDTALADLWDRLAKARPPLAEGGVAPNAQAGERLADALVELTRFAHDVDGMFRPFFENVVRHHAALARPWELYARSGSPREVTREVIAPLQGKHAGVLKMRLLGLQRLAMAFVMGTDAALESIANELDQHLRGEHGLRDDPQRRLRDYLRDDGHHFFQQQMRELRAQKIAAVYTHGG